MITWHTYVFRTDDGLPAHRGDNMKTETHSWLKHVDILGDKVEKVVAEGANREVAIKEAAHLSVEIDGFNFFDICTDLAGKEVRNEFAAQVDLHAFARAVFTERVGLG